jgi:putative FmdB family regulatory protein
MPIYDYTCKKCGHSFEALVTGSMKAACPSCGSAQLKKGVSAPVAPGRSASIIARGRVAAERAGHLSNYKRRGGRVVD